MTDPASPHPSSRAAIRPPALPEPPRSAEVALRSSQLVSLVLVIGLLIGGGTLGFLGLTRTDAAAQPTGTSSEGLSAMLAVAVPALGVAALVVVFVAPMVMARAARKRWESRADDEAAMGRVYQGFVSMSVVQGAALEGPGFLGAVSTYLTGNWMLLLATLGSVVALAVLFPRAARIESWIDEVTGGGVDEVTPDQEGRDP
ncbi:MAG: hypothetical protein Q8L55_10415 [Phycisphaerales bacterium]|nr:hypothetical protein [Phycisphaerales bacterium]